MATNQSKPVFRDHAEEIAWHQAQERQRVREHFNDVANGRDGQDTDTVPATREER
jgi:phage terminase Nu1 subunit (DNA packaging protein)